jgi:hydrogenase large subunit
MDTKGTQFALPGGYIPAGDIGQFAPLASQREKTLHEGIKESIKHAWYNGAWDRSPYDEETVPDYTGYDYDKKYSWVKAPTYLGKPAQVGPLPHVVAMYLAGHEPTKTYVDNTLKTVSAIAGATVGIDALHSTIGRIAARVIRCAVLHDNLGAQWQALIDNIGKGDYRIHGNELWDPKEWPAEASGFGWHEAPRGALGHWIKIKDQKILNYQAVVPSTWNASPRDTKGLRGPYEAALVGTPLAKPDQPLEILRTVHSFDPCLACAVHLTDTTGAELVQVKIS